jgi:pimeloyl-ACP methyl ester carboxylesterase
MGAVTAIMFAERYGDYLDALVLDGPFKSLSTIVERASYEASHLPQPIIRAFLFFVRRKVDSELGM